LKTPNAKAPQGNPERRGRARPWTKDASAKASGSLDQSSGFAEECYEPILRVSAEGKILFANAAAEALLRFWKTNIGGTIPSPWPETLGGLMAGAESMSTIELDCSERVFALTLQPVRASGYVNV
jgi:hypothetical protein